MSIEERGRALEEAFFAKKNQELLANEKLLQEVLENNENLHDDIARLEYQIDQGFVRRLLRFFGF